METIKMNSNSIKKAIICKNVKSTLVNKSIVKSHAPLAGDVAIFRIKEIGKHTRLQTVGGNNKFILPGDLIMVAFGNRYATEQLEGYVPETYHDTYHILGQGGAIGILESIHEKFELKGPTTLELFGYVVDEEGEVINTKYLNSEDILDNYYSMNSDSKVILSLGTSMDSGKTTSAAFLARGLRLAGKKVSYIKLTGTVHAKDRGMVRDYGAELSIDFSNFGFPSTYMCSTEEILVLFQRLLAWARSIGPDYVIVEIADGLLQRETYALIKSERFGQQVSGAIFSAGDSMSAISGADMLTQYGHKVLGVTGVFTRSPLLIDEVKERSGYDVLNGTTLMSRDIADFIEQKLNQTHFDDKKILVS